MVGGVDAHRPVGVRDPGVGPEIQPCPCAVGVAKRTICF